MLVFFIILAILVSLNVFFGDTCVMGFFDRYWNFLFYNIYDV